MRQRLDRDLTPPRAIRAGESFLVAFRQNNTAGRKIGTLNEFHQIFDGDIIQFLPIEQHVAQGIHHFPQVMRRDAGGHAHGNAGSAIDQQIGNRGWQHDWFFERAIKVWDQINRFFLNISQHFHGWCC